jgi:hypothetical protein
MEETKTKPDPIVHLRARTKITIEHGRDGFTAEFETAGRSVLVRGVNAHEALSKAGQIIDDLAHVIRTYMEDAAHGET